MKWYWIVSSAAMLLLLLVGCNRQNGSSQALPSAPATVSVSEQDPPDFVPVDKQPAVLSPVSPEYPAEDRKNGTEGSVVVKLIVTSNGSVEKATVVRNEGATATMESAAVTAAKQWKFSPAIKDGKPVAVWVSIPFKFRLADKDKGAAGASFKKGTNPEYKQGYIAGRKEALSLLEQRAAEARQAGKPDASLEKTIEQQKAEIKKLEK